MESQDNHYFLQNTSESCIGESPKLHSQRFKKSHIKTKKVSMGGKKISFRSIQERRLMSQPRISNNSLTKPFNLQKSEKSCSYFYMSQSNPFHSNSPKTAS